MTVHSLVIGGWTGRDPAAVQAHIAELAALGIAPPPTVPVYYRVAASRLTTADTIQVTSPHTSGEAECVVLQWEGRLWLLAGSDHTDRAAEAYDITVSKQMCDKPVSSDAWSLALVAGHWDRLRIQSWADGELYQDGSAASLLGVEAVMAGMGGLGDGTALFCGTLAVLGGIRPAQEFRAVLFDPISKCRLTLAYRTQDLSH